MKKTSAPEYWPGVKAEARQRVSLSPMVQGCQAGEQVMVCALLIVFWRFVHDFAEILFNYFETADDPLVRRMKGQLSGITDDEKSHRKMWRQTAEFLGITELLDPNKDRFQKVVLLSEHLRESVPPALIFLRIVAVEVVAEALSEELLSSQKFEAVLPRKYRAWFIAHIVHESTGTTHEQIALRLAIRKLEESGCVNVEEIVREEVLHVIDLFVNAATDAPVVAKELEFPKAA